MRSTGSAPGPNTISVQLDSQGFHAGEKIAGKICLLVSKPISAESVNLKFYGQEFSEVSYSVRNYGRIRFGRSNRIQYTAHQSHQFINIDCPISTFPSGEVPAGQYEFPFVFDLPSGLPGSLPRYRSGSHFTVSYYLEARLHRKGLFKWDVISQQEVFLLDIIKPPTIAPSLLPPVTQPVYYCSCFKLGEITLLANVSNTQVQVGDTLIVNFSISNRSTAKIKTLDIELQQTTRHSAQGHPINYDDSVYRQEIKGSELDATAPVDTKIVAVNGDYNAVNQEMYSQMRSVSFVVSNARSSFSGVMGTISHKLTVSVGTDKGKCNLIVSIPLSVTQASIPAYYGHFLKTGLANPADWHPQVAPVVVLEARPAQQV